VTSVVADDLLTDIPGKFTVDESNAESLPWALNVKKTLLTSGTEPDPESVAS
jgi:hypothetical protein